MSNGICQYQTASIAVKINSCSKLLVTTSNVSCGGTLSLVLNPGFWQQKLCLEVRLRRRFRNCNGYGSRVIRFSRGSMMMGFSSRKLFTCILLIDILKRQHKQCRSHICPDQDTKMSYNTREILTNLSEVPIACLHAVGAQDNNTTLLGWQTCSERWLKNDRPS